MYVKIRVGRKRCLANLAYVNFVIEYPLETDSLPYSPLFCARNVANQDLFVTHVPVIEQAVLEYVSINPAISMATSLIVLYSSFYTVIYCAYSVRLDPVPLSLGFILVVSNCLTQHQGTTALIGLSHCISGHLEERAAMS